LAGAFRRQHIG